MFKQIIKKIKNKKWLTLCLILGLSFLVATLSCHPMFQAGSLDKLANNLFAGYVEDHNSYSALISKKSTCPASQIKSMEDMNKVLESNKKEWNQKVSLPVIQMQDMVFFRESRTTTTYGLNNRYYMLSYMPNLLEHAQMLYGQDYATYDGEGIPCVISESVMDEYGLAVGEKITFDQWINESTGKEIELVVSGVFKEKDSNDLFWYVQPNTMKSNIFVAEDVFSDVVANAEFNYIGYQQTVLYDYRPVNHKNAEKIYDNVKGIVDKEKKKKEKELTENFTTILQEYKEGKKTVSITLWVLSIPILGMVLAYIYMVSCQIIETEKNEIAMLKSRGISRMQVISMYMLQSILLSAVSLLVGIPFGFLLCKLGAATTDFLSFSLKDLSLYGFVPQMILYGLAATVIGIVFFLIPVIASSKISIVQAKSMDAVNKKAVWEKYFIDVVLLLISCYLIYNFNQDINNIRMNAINGEKMDPMVFLDSVLFIIALGLVILRLTHHLVKLVYKLGRNRWSPAMYASFLQITRTSGKQGFISVFLILTVALGLFNANIARTINRNNVARIEYDMGADVQVLDDWKKKIYVLEDRSMEYEFVEPDYAKYDVLLEKGLCDRITRVVFDDKVDISCGTIEVNKCMMQGISTKEFGETASLRDEFNKEKHWYEALNSIATKQTGVIISSNLAKELKAEVGSNVRIVRYGAIESLKEKERGRIIGTVCAIVDAWPGYDKYYYEDGELKENYLIVANYPTVFKSFKVSPYKVWMNLADGVKAGEVEQAIEEMGVPNIEVSSVEEETEEMKNSPLIQITNGMFTLSFVIALVLCAVGFMIYWISSIRQRELLFGVYRAMGMTVKEINRMLINEHIFSTLLSVISGGIVGMVSTVLFAKLFGVVYLPKQHVIDIFIHCEFSDVLKLAVTVAFMIVACIIVLRKQVQSMNITQALKLGED